MQSGRPKKLDSKDNLLVSYLFNHPEGRTFLDMKNDLGWAIGTIHSTCSRLFTYQKLTRFGKRGSKKYAVK
jgi:hypothetical protein